MEASASPGSQAHCTLISAGCTTGWADWIHGELWLCPDGLLHKRLTLLATIRHGVRPTLDPAARPQRSFSTAEIIAIRTANRRNLWLPWTLIEHARLSHIPTATQLHLQLTDGRNAKLLWVPLDPSDLVADKLSERLQGRFTMR